MSHETVEDVSNLKAFRKHLGMFVHPRGAHLTERTRPLGEWIRQRTELSTWPYERTLEENGLLANLVEFPAVPKSTARFRFQVMASHTDEQIEEAVRIFRRSLERARDMISAPSLVLAEY